MGPSYSETVSKSSYTPGHSHSSIHDPSSCTQFLSSQ